MDADFSKLNGFIPAVIQDVHSHKVLTLGFMNKEALDATIKEGKVTFYDFTKKRLWKKGAQSGHFFEVKDILLDCNKDTVLIKVEPRGPACQTGADTCFNEENTVSESFFNNLEEIVKTRKELMPKGAYTTSLFKKGLNKIVQKVGEEAVEVVIAAKDDDKNEFLNEAADLVYHFLVLLRAKGVEFSEIEAILKERNLDS